MPWLSPTPRAHRLDHVWASERANAGAQRIRQRGESGSQGPFIIRKPLSAVPGRDRKNERHCERVYHSASNVDVEILRYCPCVNHPITNNEYDAGEDYGELGTPSIQDPNHSCAGQEIDEGAGYAQIVQRLEGDAIP
jgi:hypothetical protein